MQYRYIPLLLVLCLLNGCESSNDDAPQELLQDITSEIVYFEYIPDTGNNSSLIRYEIKLNNPNNVAVQGFYTVTLEANGTQSFVGSNTASPCYQIGANSDCNSSYERTGVVDPEGTPDSIKIVAIEYNIEQ